MLGEIVGRLGRHQAGVLMTEMSLDPACFDAPAPWRPRAMNGQLHSGHVVDHPRSRDTTSV